MYDNRKYNVNSFIGIQVSSFQVSSFIVTYTTIQRLYNQQWNEVGSAPWTVQILKKKKQPQGK